MAIQATGRATFMAVEDYDIVFILNGIRCDVLNFDSVRTAESAVLEADFFNGGTSCVVDKAILGCYDGEGTLMGSPIEVHDTSSAVADGGSLYLSKDCKTITCDIYAGGKKLCGKCMPVIRNGSSVGVKAVSYKVINNVDAGTSLNWDGVQSQTSFPTQKPDKGKYCYVMTIVLYTDGTSTNTVSTSYTPNDGTSVKVASTKVEYAGGDNGTNAPTSGWQTSVPQLAQGKYLWTRTTVSYSDNNSTTSYSVGRIGMDGSKGGTTHILYASSASPNSSNDVKTVIDSSHQYYGTYQDTEVNDDVNKYTSVGSWVLIKGKKGDTPPMYSLNATAGNNDIGNDSRISFNGKTLATSVSRGHTIYFLRGGVSPSVAFTKSYDTYGTPSLATDIATYLTSKDANAYNDCVLVIIGFDALTVNDDLRNALKSYGYGGDNLLYNVSLNRTSFVFIGQKGMTEGTAYYKMSKTSKVSLTASVSNGVLVGTGHKGDKGDTPTVAKLRVDHSALHYNPSTNNWDYDSVTVTIVIITPSGTKIPAYGDISEYYWLLDNDTTKRSSGMGFGATLNAASRTVTLYKNDGSNVAIDTITVPMVRDGQDGVGTAATVYTIEAVGNNNNSGTLKNASTIAVTLIGNLKLYKTVGSEKTEDSKPPQCWRLTVGGTNVDGTRAFTNSAGNNIVSYSYSQDYSISSDGNRSVPGSATVSVYKDNTLSELLASLVIPITLNAGAIVDVNTKLGTIESTTMSNSSKINGLSGTIETIKQGQGQISLKVQEIERKSRNLISGGNVTGLYNKKYEVFCSSAFKMEQGKTYTVTARLWMESASNGHHVMVQVFGADNSWSPFYHSDELTNTSGSVVRFSFEAGATKQMVAAVYERNSSGADPGSGNYNGVHVDWMRVDEGDWTGTGANGRTLDQWEPSEEETDAVNLLPDPGFEETIGYTDGMGERRCFDRLSGGSVAGMSRDSSTVDGCHGIKIENKNGTGDTYDVLGCVVPFRGAGTYSLSYFVKDLHQTDAGKPAWDNGYGVYVECHPLDANKTRITEAMFCVSQVDSSRLGDGRLTASHTFGDTAARSGTSTVVRIAYLEVRVYLLRNGSVRISRLCLSKSDHFIYWNANALSEARKKDAALLATGIDIDSKTVTMTGKNFVWQNNAGVKVVYMDDKGNATFCGVVNAIGGNFTGTVTGSSINGSTINGSTFISTSSDGSTSVTKIEGGQITTNNINAKGGSVSFFKFDGAGMYSGNVEDDGKIYSGLGMSMNNLSVSGNSNNRISSVFLGSGWKDSRYTNSDNYRPYRVGSTTLASEFYNYIKLERIGSGSYSFENDPTHAALGIETQGDFCLTALGGPSQFAGMCFASDYVSSGATADKKHCFYQCSGGAFTMPNNPPIGLFIVVIQVGSQIRFYGNGHKFRSGTNYSDTCNSNSLGQWTLFHFDGSYWNTVYLNGRPW